ncbi:MAG: penicillin-binding protein 2 [Pseudomonadales bacterium]|nr:penicillin-binding protein 2 [Pseudomonadales bacterium]
MASLDLNDKSEERALFGRRVIVLLVGVVVLLGILVGRLVQLQVIDHAKYQTRSENNRIQVQPMVPRRGLIMDHNGVLLADNRPIHNLAIVKERVGDLDAMLAQLRTLLTLDEGDEDAFRKRLKRQRRPYEPILLKSNLTEEERARLALERYRLAGVEVVPDTVRFYPFGELYAHALGSVRRVNEDDLRSLDPVKYAGTEFIGKLGVEKFYEASLHGDVGYQQVEVDAYGRIRKELNVDPPKAGRNLRLFLDADLQIAADAALGERRGAVVAIDPRTGGILAMVSKPAYDPNHFVTGISAREYNTLLNLRSKPMFNRVINGRYAPGSTFKPAIGLAALSNRVLTWDETIFDQGSFRLPHSSRIYRDWSWQRGNSGGQGIVDLNRAIYRSSNVFFYTMASRMKIEQITQFVSQLGFGRVTSADVADASPGLLPDPAWKRAVKKEPWYPGDNVNLGIGQGDLLVTPLQLASYVSVIANRGHFRRPRLLADADGELSEEVSFDALPDVQGPSPDDWEKLVDAMENVVHRGNLGFRQSGTAWPYIGQDISYRMAGKSGTAQVVEIKQGHTYDETELDEYQRKHAWFIAFAPADDPMIAIAVLVENGGGGSGVAAPVAREVADAYILPRLLVAQHSAAGS